MDSCNFTNKPNSHTAKVEIHTRQKLCHFGRYAAKAELLCLKSFAPVTRAGEFIWEIFIPGYRDLGLKNRDLGYRASPASYMYIDFLKAFDSLERNFLQRCLESFNFGPNFIRWVMTFYKNKQSCVIDNGITSNYFTIERGVRQGDPLSPYLFVVAVETLAIVIRQNSTIKGITSGKKETKLLQYADDTTAVLSDINSAQTLFRLLDDFKSH